MADSTSATSDRAGTARGVPDRLRSIFGRSIFYKLLIPLTAVLAIWSLGSLFALDAVKLSQEHYEHLHTAHLKMEHYLAELFREFLDQALLVSRHIDSRDPAEMSKMERAIEQSFLSVHDTFHWFDHQHEVGHPSVIEEHEKEGHPCATPADFVRLRRDTDAYEAELRQVLRLSHEGQHQKAQDRRRRRLQPILQRVGDLTNYLMDVEDRHIGIFYHEATRIQKRAAGIAVALFLFGGLLAFVVAYRVSRTTSTRIGHLASAALALGEGKLDTRAPVDGFDEPAALARGLNEMATRLATVIAELEHKHEALETSEKRLQRILDHCTAPVYLKDTEGRYTIVNRSFGEAACLAPAEIVGKSDSQLFPAEIAVRRHAQDAGVLLNREPITVEEVLPAAGRHGPQTYLSVKFPVFDESGSPYGVGGFLTDITERKQVEELRNEFVSVVSHELRTPLTAIRGSLGLIDGGVVTPVSERGKNLLRMAVGNTDRLIRLLNDILDLEKIESRQTALETRPVDVSDLIAPLLDDLTAIAESANISLVYHHPGVSLPVRADPDRLVQVVTNLVHNAIKFSPPNTAVELHAAALPSGFVRVSVSDSGQGISKQNQAKIFAKFSQLDTSATRQAGGTGLGLAICKTIVTQHGGTIGVDSSPGRGSTFYFTIPQSNPPSGETRASFAESERNAASTFTC